MQPAFRAWAGLTMATAQAIPTTRRGAEQRHAPARLVDRRPCLTGAAGCTAAPRPDPGPKREKPRSGHRARNTATTAKRRLPIAAKLDRCSALSAKPLDPLRTYAMTDTPTRPYYGPSLADDRSSRHGR